MGFALEFDRISDSLDHETIYYVKTVFLPQAQEYRTFLSISLLVS